MTSSLHWGDYTVMLVYFAAMVSIGYISTHREKNKDSKGYLLGGGKMPYFALGISCLMASLSAFSLVMVPGEIYNHGLSMFALGLLPPFLTIIAAYFFLPFYFKLNAFTPFAYLEHRYSPFVRTLASALGLYSSMTYLGMVLFSTSKIFLGAAGWPPLLTIMVIGSISLVFTSAGGLKAVVWTDVMQFIVLIGGLCCILFFLFWKIDGGFVGAVATTFQQGHGFGEFAKADFYLLSPYNRLSVWLLALSAVVAAVQIIVTDQMTIQRMLASGSYKNAVKSQMVNGLFTLPTNLILWVIGIGTFVFFFQHPEMKPESGDTALFTFISSQIPVPIPGLILAGMLAAVISTLNAVFNSMATIYVKEFHVRYFQPDMPEEKQVRLSKRATLMIGALAIGQGILVTFSSGWLKQSVIEASTIFSIFSAIVLPAFLYAMCSRRASTRMIWVVSGLLWGLKGAMIFWYIMSTNALNNWAPGMPLGYAGPMPFLLPLFFFACGIALTVFWEQMRKKESEWQSFLSLLPNMVTGFGLGLILWSIFSNCLIDELPRAISFQWLGLPADILCVVVGVIWLNFGKVQPEEKWKGMIFTDMGQEEKKK